MRARLIYTTLQSHVIVSLILDKQINATRFELVVTAHGWEKFQAQQNLFSLVASSSLLVVTSYNERSTELPAKA